jgi:acyl-CoA-dependent ceramide synthase
MILWSVWKDLPVVMPLGCYSTTTKERLPQYQATQIGDYLQPFLQQSDVICFDKKVHWHFLSLLLALKVILLIWFGMIVRVAWTVINGQNADDSRSDSEEEEEEGGKVGKNNQIERKLK